MISFLNAVLELAGEDIIIDVTIIDPYQAPKILGMKDTYLDVRVKDHRGRSYVVEMQVLNVEGFEKRVLYNACKAYVGQLHKGDGYHILTEVIAVTITDFLMFPDLERVVSRFRLRADENHDICHQDLELVFAELPKFHKTDSELETTLDRWLYFLKTADDLTAVPQALAVEPAIVKALDIANRTAWTEDELEAQEQREMWIGTQRRMQEDAARKIEDAARKMEDAARKMEDAARRIEEAEQIREDAVRLVPDAEQKGHNEGKAEGKAEMLIEMFDLRFGPISPEIQGRVRVADSAQLHEWSRRFVNARTLAEVFDPRMEH